MPQAAPKLKLWLPLLAALFAIPGCSSNSATTRQVVDLADLSLPNDSLAVVVKSVSISPKAAASRRREWNLKKHRRSEVNNRSKQEKLVERTANQFPTQDNKQ